MESTTRSFTGRRTRLARAGVAAVALAAFAAFPAARALGSEDAPGHSHQKAARHGGDVQMTRGHHFEATWRPDGLRVYLYTAGQAPMKVAKAEGKVTFRMADGASKDVVMVREAPAGDEHPTVYFCPMHPEVVQLEPGICTQCGTMKLFVQDRFFAPIDLATAAPGSLKAFVQVTGLKGEESEASFVATFAGMTTAGKGKAHEDAAPGKEPAKGHEKGHEGHSHH